MNHEEPQSGQTHAAHEARQFRVIRLPEKPRGPRRCPHCLIDYAGCPECERRELIPNAVEIAGVAVQHFHHGRCHRHGMFWRRCQDQPDIEGIGDHNSERVTRATLIRVSSVCLLIGFLGGLCAAIVLTVGLGLSFAQ